MADTLGRFTAEFIQYLRRSIVALLVEKRGTGVAWPGITHKMKFGRNAFLRVGGMFATGGALKYEWTLAGAMMSESDIRKILHLVNSGRSSL